MRAIRMKKNDSIDGVVFEDADTGDMIQDVAGAHIQIRAGEMPKMTLEINAHECPMEIETEDFKLEQKHLVDFVRDKNGNGWIRAAWLAKQIRENGTMCQHNGAKAVENRFSDELLQTWETVETRPQGGAKPQETHHG